MDLFNRNDGKSSTAFVQNILKPPGRIRFVTFLIKLLENDHFYLILLTPGRRLLMTPEMGMGMGMGMGWVRGWVDGWVGGKYGPIFVPSITQYKISVGFEMIPFFLFHINQKISNT